MLKPIAHRLISNPKVGSVLRLVCRRRSVSLMLHRFRDNARGVAGHDPEQLRAFLGYLRQIGVALVSVDDQVEQLLNPNLSGAQRPTVSFTIDDGYCEIADIAQPIFAEFDAPFTIFVAPGVAEGNAMFWWDQLEWLVANSKSPRLAIENHDGVFRAAWENNKQRRQVLDDIFAVFKTLAPDQRDSTIQALSEQFEVTLPETPPEEYQILNWDQLRALESRGAFIGAHTMTHPILSLCDDQRAEWEVEESLRRVRAEVVRPSAVFCYPNGMTGDFSEREAMILQRCDAVGAVTAMPGVLFSGRRLDPNSPARWQLPRVPYDGRPGTLFRSLFY